MSDVLRWRYARRLAVVCVLAAALVSPGGAAPAAPKYLAVFVDGRVLPVEGARLLDERTMRLELGGDGSVDVPLARIDRIVEAAVDPEPEPIPIPACTPDFEPQELPQDTPYRRRIVAASRAAGLHPWLVAAVVEAESRFDRQAVSRVGARGLMQLMPAVWIEEGLRDPNDVAANLRAGCAHLRRLIDRFGDLTLALAAYNAGAAAVEQAGGVPPYRETRTFVRRVLSRFCPDGDSAAVAAK